jgi:hypothetical protein
VNALTNFGIRHSLAGRTREMQPKKAIEFYSPLMGFPRLRHPFPMDRCGVVACNWMKKVGDFDPSAAWANLAVSVTGQIYAWEQPDDAQVV